MKNVTISQRMCEHRWGSCIWNLDSNWTRMCMFIFMAGHFLDTVCYIDWNLDQYICTCHKIFHKITFLTILVLFLFFQASMGFSCWYMSVATTGIIKRCWIQTQSILCWATDSISSLAHHGLRDQGTSWTTTNCITGVWKIENIVRTAC